MELLQAPQPAHRAASNSPFPSAGAPEPLDLKSKLLLTIEKGPNLPALGSCIARIVKLSSSDDQSVRQLAYYVLSDVALTQKILRLSNSAAFKTVTNKDITSINKAIFLLGFDSIKTSALAVLLVDGMPEKHAEHVRTELILALAASMISRKLVKLSPFTKDVEEVSIAALFKNLGRVILATYEPHHYFKMMELINQKAQSPAQASLQILGFRLDLLLETLLEEWNVPINVIQALKEKPQSTLSEPKNKQEWMQIATEFSEKAAPLIFSSTEPEDLALKSKLLARFGKVLNFNDEILKQILADATTETRELLISVDLASLDRNKKIDKDDSHSEFDLFTDESLLNELTLNDDGVITPQITDRHPSSKPTNTPAILLSGIQRAIETMSTGNYRLENLILQILEVLHSALGFRFITLCLRDSKMNVFRARSSFGQKNQEYQKVFSFSTIIDPDLYHLALQRDIDLVITNATTPRIRMLLPEWHMHLFPNTRSFVIFPLVINKKPMGLIYADREIEAPEGITIEEAKLIKILKDLMILALNSK